MTNRKKSAGTKAGKSAKAAVKTSSQTIGKPNVGRSFLKSLEIDVDKKGFTIWVRERKKIGKKMVSIKHWVMDGSLFLESGIINMGQKDMYNIEARYNEVGNYIEVGR